MLLIEESVKALSGRAFRRIIRMYTNGRVWAIGSGALVTALLQSRSTVSLMVLAFINYTMNAVAEQKIQEFKINNEESQGDTK